MVFLHAVKVRILWPSATVKGKFSFLFCENNQGKRNLRNHKHVHRRGFCAWNKSQELEKQWIFSSLLTLFPFSSFPVWLSLAQFQKLMVISFAYNHFYVSSEGCVRNILERPGLILRVAQLTWPHCQPVSGRRDTGRILEGELPSEK